MYVELLSSCYILLTLHKFKPLVLFIIVNIRKSLKRGKISMEGIEQTTFYIFIQYKTRMRLQKY